MNRSHVSFVWRLDRLDNPLERADLVLSTKEAAIALPETVAFLMERFDSEDPVVRLAIASAISRVLGDNSPDGIYETLLRAIKRPEEVAERYNQLAYKADYAEITGAIGVSFFKTRRDETVRELSTELDKHSRYIGTNLSHALLLARFQLDPPELLRACDLTVEQRDVLNIILSSRRPWVLNGNMAESLGRFGLPQTKDQMEQFLKT